MSSIPELRRAPVWRRGIGLGRIRGTRIVVAPSWFASAAAIVVLATPIVGRVTGSGTATVAAAAVFRIPVLEVRLYLVGGVSQLERAPRSAKEEALVAAAGPAASAVLAVICWALLASTERYSVAWLIALEMAVSNGIVAVFNILPALPLDGGRVLRAAFWGAGRRERTGTIAGVLGGLAVAAALLVWAATILSRPDRPGVLLAVIIATMALFVAAGAWSEWPRRPKWPAGMTLSSVMRPARLIMTGGPQPGPGDGATMLITPDGRPVGLIEVTANTSRTASYPSVIPLEPEMIVSPGESPSAVVQRMVARSLPYVAVTGAGGRIEGVVMRTDVERAMAGLGA